MTPGNIIDAIQDARNAQRSLWLWGPPGVGKTAIVRAAANLLGIELTVTRVVEHEPVDYGGFPIPDAGGQHVNRLVERWVPQHGTKGILFLDELAQATEETQCAAMRLVDSVPAGWSVIAASNRLTDRAGTRQSPTHVLDRFTHLEFDVSRDDWHKWAMQAGIHASVRSFLDFRPELFSQFDAKKVQEERTSCNPRSWEGVSNIMFSCRQHVRREMIAGTVGIGPAAEFTTFVELASSMPDLNKIIADPDRAEIPDKPSVIYALCGAISDHIREATDQAREALVTYVVRLPLEFAALGMTDCMHAVQIQVNKTGATQGGKSLLAIPAASNWLTKNQSVFAKTRK